MSGAIEAPLIGAQAALLAWGIWVTWRRMIDRVRLAAEAEEVRRLRHDFLYPAISAADRAALEAIAARSSHLSTALRFRGQLLADRLRKRNRTPDLSLATILRDVLEAGDAIEVYAIGNDLDPYTTLRHILAAAVTELAALERALEPAPEAAQ